MYHNSTGWHSIMSTGRGGPYGHQSVYAMFIPWQANKKCRDDAYDVILKEKQYGNAQRYVIVDPMGVGQEEI